MSVTMQKQSSRNLVISPKTTAYGAVLADADLSRRATIDPSTNFAPTFERYSDQGAAGHGTEFATVSVVTSKDTAGTVKGMGATDEWMIGWMLSLLFGEVTTTGAGPYTHVFGIPNISSVMPCTTVYAEDTADVHRKYVELSAKSISIDIPERGPIQASLDMVGTGKWVPGDFSTALPAVVTPNLILGSDITLSIFPAGGALKSYAGRQRGLSIKVDRGTTAFKSSGDGYTAGSNQSGKLAFGFDVTIMADDTDDIVGTFEGDTLCAVTIATDPTKTYQLSFSFANAKIKVNKLGNVEDKVAWQLSFDESTIIQVGNTPAITATLIGSCPGYLIPA